MRKRCVKCGTGFETSDDTDLRCRWCYTTGGVSVLIAIALLCFVVTGSMALAVALVLKLVF